MTGHESAAALADSSMWEEVNGANPQMVVEGDLIWRGAGVCADPVALAQAAMEEITRLTRERDEARDRIVALEAQLTTRGACECGADDVCALARRAQEAEARATAAEARVKVLAASATDETEARHALRARIAELEGALRGLLLSRDASWTGGHDWQDAVDRAAALLIPTAPTAGAGKRKLCGRPIDDEHGNPTDQPCGFTRPCIYHDAPKAKSHYGWPNLPTPAPEQAGEEERCPHACIDEHEQPTNDPCPFNKPCPVHDAREVRRG